MLNNIQDFNPDYREIICKNIKKYRKENGIRLMDLAELLDVSPDYLKRLESPGDSRKNCSLTLVYKLSLILEKKIDDFFKE